MSIDADTGHEINYDSEPEDPVTEIELAYQIRKHEKFHCLEMTRRSRQTYRLQQALLVSYRRTTFQCRPM